MPVGVIVNSSVVLIGGSIGAFVGSRLPDRIVKELPAIFGLSAIAMGITLIVNLVNLTPVILAIILGAILGEALRLEYRLTKLITRFVETAEHEHNRKTEMLITAIVLFCFSGTGIFGVLNEGFTGDSSILITKSVLDFFTAITFGASMGYIVSLVAIPQFILYIVLYLSAGLIIPLMTNDMLLDFKACGGIITMAVGLKLAQIRSFNVINIVPAIVLVIPLSYLWSVL